jgi:hypothetical protein
MLSFSQGCRTATWPTLLKMPARRPGSPDTGGWEQNQRRSHGAINARSSKILDLVHPASALHSQALVVAPSSTYKQRPPALPASSPENKRHSNRYNQSVNNPPLQDSFGQGSAPPPPPPPHVRGVASLGYTPPAAGS